MILCIQIGGVFDSGLPTTMASFRLRWSVLPFQYGCDGNSHIRRLVGRRRIRRWSPGRRRGDTFASLRVAGVLAWTILVLLFVESSIVHQIGNTWAKKDFKNNNGVSRNHAFCHLGLFAQTTYFARGHPFSNPFPSFDPSSSLLIFENLLPVGGRLWIESESNPNRIIRRTGKWTEMHQRKGARNVREDIWGQHSQCYSRLVRTIWQSMSEKNSETARDLASIFGEAAACSDFGEFIGVVDMMAVDTIRD